MYKVRQQLTGWQIVHQSGESELDATRTLYAKLDLPATVVPFLGDMPAVLSATDLAVCRAGGTTLAELAAVGRAGPPAALSARHRRSSGGQRPALCPGRRVRYNRRAPVAGRLDDQLADMLCFLLANDGLRGQMAAAMHELARPHAADDVAELIWSIVSSRALRAELAVA